MRPVRLELEGFGAFRDRTVVDFEGADLFALSGPTGSGKTTVVDAVCFALYGSIPRYDDKRLVAPAISQGLPEAKVRLDFTVGGRAHTAVRVVKRLKAGASTKEARLEAGGEVVAGNEKELTAAVEALLGLSYEHFTKCVVLPQGDFARFLHDKPDRRQELLVELLDLGIYGTMAGLAHDRARVAAAKASLVEDRLAALAEVTPEARTAALARVEELAALRADLDAALPALAELDQRAAGARRAATEAHDRAQLLGAVRVPRGVAELGAALAAGSDAVRVATQREDAAVDATAKAQAALDAMRPRHELEAVATAYARRAALRAQQAKGEPAVDAARTAAVTAAAAEERAAEALAAATAALEAAQVSHAAHALREHLTAGAACPVCEQRVTEVPGGHSPADLEAARAARAAADAALKDAAQERAAAADHRARVEQKLASVVDQLAELDLALVDEPGVKELERLLGELDEAEAIVAAARRAEGPARAARQEALAAVERARKDEQRARQAFHAAHAPLVALGAPAPAGQDLVADWDALAAWAQAQVPALQTEAERAAAEASEIERAHRDARAAIEERCRAAAVEVRSGVDPLEAVVVARTVAEQVVARLDEQLAELEHAAGERAALREEEAVASALHRHLGSRGFEKWLLDEALIGLVEGATGTLLVLSGGQYSLCLDGRGFAVVDHRNADQVRSARSLSGGETFLASLALALALADQLALLSGRGGARLESLFLDEGFGTLDPEALDTVASAIDELGSTGRMVGLISHVPELAERVPVRFEVRKVSNAATIEKILQ